MLVIVDEYGMSIGKKSERLIIKKRKEVVKEIPLIHVSEVVLQSKGISISSDVVEACMEQGILLHFSDFREQPIASLYSPTVHGTVLTRRMQLAAYEDERGIHIAKKFVKGKIVNQIRTLKYFMRSRKDWGQAELVHQWIKEMEENVKEIDKVISRHINEGREKLLSIEGRASYKYWLSVQQILSDKITFKGREHRGTQCPVNGMLNYGYKILETQIQGAIFRAGLEPYAGFLHADRSGRASLTLDLIEEFRQPLVDRVVISMLTKGSLPKVDEEGLLTEDCRNQLRIKLNERLESKDKIQGKSRKLRSIIQIQARNLSMYFQRGQEYKAFIGSW